MFRGEQMRIKPSTALGIISWGLILLLLILLLLKHFKLVASPSFQDIALGAILTELLRLELKLKEVDVKFELLWSEFKKRKRV
jgi:hypothetical protein